MTDYAALSEYCYTKRQREIFDALIKSGSHRKAAKALGISDRRVTEAVARVKNAAAGRDKTQHAGGAVPEGYAIHGASTYITDHLGNKQWIKTRVDEEYRLAMMREAVSALSEQITPAPTVKPPKTIRTDLLTQYTITDYHIGMLAWAEETGDDWDTDIAEDMLVRWFELAITATPDSHTAIFAQLGDFLHWDGLEAVTPQSKHVVDSDSRYRLLIRVAMRVTRRVIDMLLRKHRHVHVIICEGNHDESGSGWLAEFAHNVYTKERRVTVDVTPDIYYAYEFGRTALFYHHGHKRRPTNIDSVFVAKFREIYGRTKHHFAHMGHMHHDKVLETNLMRVEQHRTLAGADSYASRGGWISQRDAKAITYHKEYGRVSEVVIGADMVKEAR